MMEVCFFSPCLSHPTTDMFHPYSNHANQSSRCFRHLKTLALKYLERSSEPLYKGLKLTIQRLLEKLNHPKKKITKECFE